MRVIVEIPYGRMSLFPSVRFFCKTKVVQGFSTVCLEKDKGVKLYEELMRNDLRPWFCFVAKLNTAAGMWYEMTSAKTNESLPRSTRMYSGGNLKNAQFSLLSSRELVNSYFDVNSGGGLDGVLSINRSSFIFCTTEVILGIGVRIRWRKKYARSVH